MQEDLEASLSYNPIICESQPQAVAIGRVAFEKQEYLTLKAYRSVSGP